MKSKAEIGKIYKAKHSDMQILVCGVKKDKYLCKVLTDKPGVYNGTHTMSGMTIKKRFSIVT